MSHVFVGAYFGFRREGFKGAECHFVRMMKSENFSGLSATAAELAVEREAGCA